MHIPRLGGACLDWTGELPLENGDFQEITVRKTSTANLLTVAQCLRKQPRGTVGSFWQLDRHTCTIVKQVKA